MGVEMEYLCGVWIDGGQEGSPLHLLRRQEAAAPNLIQHDQIKYCTGVTMRRKDRWHGSYLGPNPLRLGVNGQVFAL